MPADPLAVPRLVATALRRAEAGPFDLSLNAGECLAITGPSGSGKSLLLRMVADLARTRGPRSSTGGSARVSAAPTGGGASPTQRPSRGGGMTRWPPISLSTAARPRRRLPPGSGCRRTRWLGRSSACRPASGQRLGLVRVFAADPPVLLLDEPTGPLDPEATARVEDLLCERLGRGDAVVLVTHNAEQAARLGARVRRMATGRLGDPE